MSTNKFKVQWARDFFAVECRDDEGGIFFNPEPELKNPPTVSLSLVSASFHPPNSGSQEEELDRSTDALSAAIAFLQSCGYIVQVDGDKNSPYPSKLSWWKRPLKGLFKALVILKYGRKALED